MKWLCVFTLTFLLSASLYANSETDTFTPFTGRVSNQRVRLRTEPHTDSHVIKEVNRGDMFIVVGETSDFYAVLPPKEMKAYVYRTFVLDNAIEGNRVNIRLAPTLESPVIAQMNSGDQVKGTLSPENNKWYEITPPESTRLYVAKDYIEKIGERDYLATIEKRKQEIDFLLSRVQKMGQEELEKPFENIQLEESFGYIEKILNEYGDFPSHVVEAKKLQTEFQQAYLQRKIQHLESQAQQHQTNYTRPEIVEEIRENQQQLQVVEQELQKQREETRPFYADQKVEESLSDTVRTEQMEQWIPSEEQVYFQWLESCGDKDRSKESFYADQKSKGMEMRGVIEPYRRGVKHKPGDYILVNHANSLPIAYLYSTKVNLQEYVGRDVTVLVVRRPNNNFAFPAYFVLEASRY